MGDQKIRLVQQYANKECYLMSDKLLALLALIRLLPRVSTNHLGARASACRTWGYP